MSAFYYIIPVVLVSVLFWVFRYSRVAGPSMYPTLSDNSRLLLCMIVGTPRVGKIYAIKDPENENRALVKRLTAIFNEEGEKRYFFTGDNSPCSRDSRQFGGLTRKHILGKVIIVFY